LEGNTNVPRETISMKIYKSCPVCNNNSFNNHIVCKDYTVSKAEFTIVKCSQCNFTFTNPIPLESEIGKYYESEEYISHSNSNKGLVNSIYQSVRNYTLKRKLSLIKTLSSKKSLLDIGSGTGEFLNVCKTNGYHVQGIEPSKTGRDQAKENFNLNIEEESYIPKIKDNSIDIITMWHVLEHVYNLNERIGEIVRILKSDGVLIVAVPNLDSYDAKKYKEHWAAYDVPRHLYHFNPKSITTLFEKHGFILEKTLPMRFDSFYVSMLSEKYRSGKQNLINAFLTGLKSNIIGNSEKTYSSQIYVLKKAK